MPLVELGIDGGLSYKEPWGFSVKSSRKHGGKFLNLKGSVQRLRTMMSRRSGFQIPMGDGAGNCWSPMYISHISPRSWLLQCIPTRVPATNTWVSACQPSLGLECLCTQLPGVKFPGGSPRPQPHLVRGGLWGSGFQPQPPAWIPRPWRHTRCCFLLPHLPPLPTSVSRDYLRKPNRKPISSQIRACPSRDTRQDLCTN